MTELDEHERADIVAGELAEGALIGCLLRRPDDLVYCEVLRSEDFLSFHAGIAYQTILDMWRAGEAVNMLTVAMKNHDLTVWIVSIKEAGLNTLINRYVASVSEMARRRRLRTGLTNDLALVMKNDSGVTMARLSAIYESELVGKSTGTMKEGLEKLEKRVAACQSSGGELGIKTGYTGLDEKTITLQPGHVWVIGGLTSVGKTALMTSAVGNQYRYGSTTTRSIIISTEMTMEQMVARIIAWKTGISTSVHLSGGYVGGHREDATAAKNWLEGLPLLIRDDLYDWPEIEGAIRTLVLSRGLDVVWIDYVQNCRVPGARTEYEAQMTLAKGLQKLAQRCKCCVVCLSQLPNSMISGDHGKAQYKGAGEWAAVADVGINLSRTGDGVGMLVDVRKNRHGPLTQFTVQYRNNWTRLV